MGQEETGRVVVVGSVTIDEVVLPEVRLHKMGGVVTYAGLTFCKHGLETVAVTRVAPHDEGLVRMLAANGLVCAPGASGATTRFINRVYDDERIQEMPAAADPITADQLQAVLRPGDHVHLGPLHPHDLAPALLAWVAKAQPLASLDVQGYLRYVDEGHVRSRVSERVVDALRCVQVVKADRSELDTLLAALRMDVTALLQEFGLREVVITTGRSGGQVLTRAGEEVTYEATPVPHPVDPTGAGDVFFAAYLVARFHEGQGILAACSHASRCAARHVSGLYIDGATLRL